MTKKYLKTPEEVIKALKEGKTIKSVNKYEYVLKDGFILERNFGNLESINTTLFFEVNRYYIEEQEPLKLEVGKFYKTRDGRKAWIIEKSHNWDAYPFIVATPKEPGFYYVAKDGRRFIDDVDGTDLVAPWED